MSILDSAIMTLKEYKKYNKTNYMATLGIGILHHRLNQIDSAEVYYQSALDEYNSREIDTSNIHFVIDKKQIEFFLYDSTDFEDIQDRIDNDPNAEQINRTVNMFKEHNRDWLIEKCNNH